MRNVFLAQNGAHRFEWSRMGNIKEGRHELGEQMPVLVYRLLEYAMNDVLCSEYGAEQADLLFRKAGYMVGEALAQNMLDLTLCHNDFIAEVQRVLREMKIGIFRMEKFDEQTGLLVLTVAEDLDCSGLEASGEVVCTFDEGFFEGILTAYTGKPYQVREVDCWASGDRTCRFCCTPRA